MTAVLAWIIRFLLNRIPIVRIFRLAFGFVLFFYVLLYVLLSLGLYTMAKKNFHKVPFLAWIPGGQVYVLGILADQGTGRIRYAALLPAFEVGSVLSVLFLVPLAAGWIALAAGLFVTLLILWFRALYLVYAQYAKHPAPLEVLSIIFFFMGPIFIFSLRNNLPTTRQL